MYRRSEQWNYLLAAALWGVCFYAALSIASARTAWSGALCGPWGCTAPLEAIAAIHFAWVVALTPLLGLSARFLSPRRFILVSLLVTAVGAGGIAVLALREVHQAGWDFAAPYLWHRVGLRIVGATDVPLLPALLLGTTALVLGFWRRIGTRLLQTV
jgi:hypothetical protein